jgi:hypothetical protein
VLELVTKHAAGSLDEKQHDRLRKLSGDEYGPPAFLAGGLDDLDIIVLLAEEKYAAFDEDYVDQWVRSMLR